MWKYVPIFVCCHDLWILKRAKRNLAKCHTCTGLQGSPKTYILSLFKKGRNLNCSRVYFESLTLLRHSMAKNNWNKIEKNNTKTTITWKIIMKIHPLGQNLLRKSISKCDYCEARLTKFVEDQFWKKWRSEREDF